MSAIVVGGDVDAFCSKCDLELAHVVVAMSGAQPKRVLCKTCRTEHAFRRKVAVGAKPATKSARSAAAAKSKAERGFDERLRGVDISRARRYDPKVTFTEDDVLNHSMFGIGIVDRVLSDKKIETLFSGGSKVLVHAR